MTKEKDQDQEQLKEKEEIYVVGIGASAGGLEAIQFFVKHLPENLNIAYVVAQHLSPTYKSLMASLLSKETQHRVSEARNGMLIEPDHIYVCPPNKNITVFNNIIYLKELQSGTYGPKPSIDILFESLAKSKGSRCAGIILSGTGSDGSRGIRAIKAEEGFTIAQDPESAKYDGMPLAAINTGNIDLILKPEEIGRELPEIFSRSGRVILSVNAPQDHDVLKNIYAKLLNTTGIDFSEYKLNTIQRRIERRMSALKISNTSKYNNFLQKNPEEVIALFKDILIGVTSFFRDGSAFEALQKALQDYLAKKEGSTLRVWIPGCSTGEEAYSIAIIVAELLKTDIGRFKIQIFATDIDEEATHLARKGFYPESALVDMPKHLRNKYFILRKDQYEVIKPIREMVIFSRHDLNRDPPFLKLDLVSCRNLLIYFNTKLQKRVFPLFHYALNDHGLLFLGKSETVSPFQTHFKTLDKGAKIFQSNYIGPKSLPMSEVQYKSDTKANRPKLLSTGDEKVSPPSIPDLMLEQINRYILPTCVVINDNMDIVYVKGENPYVTFAEGARTDNIYRNIRQELSTELRAAVHVMLKDNKRMEKTRYQRIMLFGEVERFVRMLISRLEDVNQPPLFMICFQEEMGEYLQGYAEKNQITDEQMLLLENELGRTKEHLQTVIEELETTNEETQSLNEELQSSNEELQSSNEELETTNEELQSTNEELQTAYSELKAMYNEKEERVKLFSTMQAKMERNEDRLRIVLEANRIGIFDYTIPHSEEDLWDENFSLIMGYEPGELPRDKSLMNSWFRERIVPDHLDNFDKQYRLFCQGKMTSMRMRLLYRHRSGELRWIDWIGRSADRDEDNNVTRVVGMVMDVTDEAKLRSTSERQLEFLTRASESAGLFNWVLDESTQQIRLSAEALDRLGIDSSSDVMFEDFLNIFEKQDRGMFREAYSEALKTDTPIDVNLSTSSGVTISLFSDRPDKEKRQLIGAIQIL